MMGGTDVSDATRKAAFGDFQTPIDLADKICDLLHEVGVRPRSIVEPTCGEGNLLLAALERFPSSVRALAACRSETP